MDFVAVDVGASSTRYMSSKGKLGILPNNVVFLDKDEEVKMEPYSDDILDCLEVIVESDNSSIFPIRALMGSMATRHSATNVRPSVMVNKHMQKINYLSALVAAAIAVSKHQLSKDIALYWALPPIEVRAAKEDVIRKCLGSYKVTFPKFRGLQVSFNIVDANTYEESFMALMSFYFDKEGKIREEAKKYATGNILSLDIGASTTDLAIAKDMRYLEKSGQTYKTGGSIAREYLIDDIRGIYGFDLPNELADIAMAEGRIQFGDGYKDLRNIVESAKRHLAEQVVEQIQGYFRKVDIPIQNIRAIVVSGGGSMQGQYVNEQGNVEVTSNPMSYYITNALRNVCSGITVIQYKDNPRLAVINGLYLRASLDMRKKAMAVNQ
jgi:hypothetical protein